MVIYIRKLFVVILVTHIFNDTYCQESWPLWPSGSCNADVQDDTLVALQARRSITKASWPSCSTLVPHGLAVSAKSQNFDAENASEAFQHLYSKKFWNENNISGSLSSSGTSLDYTQALCKVFMQTAMKLLNDKRRDGAALSLNIIDAPSGDWFWMPSCLTALDAILPEGASIQYQGLDVAQKAVDLSEAGRQKFKRNQIEVAPFKRADLSKMEELKAALNNSKFDMILSYDALQYIPTSQVHAILANFNDLGNYLVVDVDTQSNNFKDIEPGQTRYIDLTKPPYALEPLCADENVLQDKSPLKQNEGEWFGVFQLPALLRAFVHDTAVVASEPKNVISCDGATSPC